jgi:hypothetical protein
MPDETSLRGLYAALLNAVTATSGSLPQGTKLLPEYPGQAIDPDDLNDAAPVGRENFSRLVDTVPLAADQFIASGINVSQIWRQVLQSAIVTGGADQAVRTAEQRLFQQAYADLEIGAQSSSIDPLGPRYQPCHPQPASWATDQGTWTRFTFDWHAETNIKATELPHFDAPLRWQLADHLDPELRQLRPHGVLRSVDFVKLSRVDELPIQLMTGPAQPAATTASDFGLARTAIATVLAVRAAEEPVPARPAVATLMAHPVAAARLDHVVDELVPAPADLEALPVLDQDFGQVLVRARIVDGLLRQQPVEVATTASLSISFSFVMLGVVRRWLDPSLLNLASWFLPGRPRSALSDGADTPVSGLLKYLPTALLLIRDLTVAAQWSEADRRQLEAGLSATFPSAFGPFRFSADTATFDGISLTCPNPQILAWFAQRMPLAPPLDPPTG